MMVFLVSSSDVVIPAQAGIQARMPCAGRLGSRLRGNDDEMRGDDDDANDRQKGNP